MSLAINVTWGGEWAVGQRLTPTLLNGIFQNAQFQISGTIATASMPPGGIDYTWIGATFITGLTAATPAAMDLLLIWDISASAHKKVTVSDVLALGFAGLSTVSSVAATDYGIVEVAAAQKKVTIRELGKAAYANQVADTAAASAGALATTDYLIGSKGGTQGKATVEQVLGGVVSDRTALASASLDLDADYVLVQDTSAGVAKKVLPRAFAGGVSAFVQFDGRSGTGALNSISGQNLTGPASDAVTITPTHGVTTGQVRQCWWTGTIPLITTPQMVVDTAYWFRALSATSMAFYTNNTDANADTNRITLASDNGSSGWVIYFWVTDPTTNSGGTIGVNGVVTLNPTDGLGVCGKYRIFLKSAASLTHPCVTANAKYYAGTDSLFAMVQSSTTTYADVWVQGADGVPIEGNPVNVMIQS